MLRIFLALLLMTTPALATTSWRNGTGANTLLGSSNASDIDSNSYNNIVKPLDDLLATYCNQYMIYASAGALTMSAGSVMVSNSDGSIRLMLRNSSTTSIDFTNLDTGAEAPGVYYVYAIAASASSTSATYKISSSSSAPSGSTYYYRIGSFTNDGSSNITASTVSNDWLTIVPTIQNSIFYVNNNSNFGAHTISNALLGQTTTGSCTFGSNTTCAVPTGCYITGGFKQGDGNFSRWDYACP